MATMAFGSYTCRDATMMLSSAIDDLKAQPLWLLLPTSLGFLTLSKSFISLLHWLFLTFLRPPKNLLASYGSWALVTGASDGIGKAFAFQLAGKGLNLILVSRNPEKLRAVSSEVRAKFPNTEVKIVALDFSGDIAAGARLIEEAVEGLEVGVLVNNAGVTYPAARFFHEVEEEVMTGVVRVNLEGTTRVTRAVLPAMLKLGRGAIVNIGSGAAIVVPSHPLFALYAATKAYVDKLSTSLSVEYKSRGIQIQCQVPLYVATKMVSNKRSSFFTPSPEEYAGAAVRRIGQEEARCMPYWPHSLQWCFASFFPDSLLDIWRLSIGIQRRAGTLPPSSL
ncbi:very-long-chain 3-oxoacyl-CoA reductase 1-like [Malania oleifera]|uniref:very-long-chain 3-oxoacyl-CoA reductase 1-like n=1 Tax=Malania oleifera TaxID=397392 RepID=UPI0025ADCC2D|nr:very-long-chain 3-oxoacyl-CoA reductase 1-like [Malania oleifera]